MTPEQRQARTKRLVSAARALLSLQVGFFVGARRIENAMSWLGPEVAKEFPIFAQFTSAVPLDIPVGTARLLWEPQAMLATDARMAAAESQFRAQLLAECVRIIQQYGDR